jgi:hypothetical protein
MTISNTTAARGLRHSGRTPKAPLKSPLAMPGGSIGAAVVSLAADIDLSAHTGAVLSNRAATLAEFEDYLRTVNNRDGRSSKPVYERTLAWRPGVSSPSRSGSTIVFLRRPSSVSRMATPAFVRWKAVTCSTLDSRPMTLTTDVGTPRNRSIPGKRAI